MNAERLQNLRQTKRLLRETFSVPKFDDERYLEWFYDENPNGRAIEENTDVGDSRVGHLAGIPQVYHQRDRQLAVIFPLNIAVAPEGRGRGLMTLLSQRCFEHARERLGVVAFVGMPNASSTPGYTGRLKFRLVRPLSVTVCVPMSPAGGFVESVRAGRSYLDSETFARLADHIDFAPGTGWSQRWSPALLRWRLASPGADYWLHVSRDGVGVSCKTRAMGVPFAVMLKFFPLRPEKRVATGPLLTAACIRQRAPVAIYAGFNERAPVTGIRLPDRLKPAPLNLIFRSLDPATVEQESFRFDTFEFLDFDAY